METRTHKRTCLSMHIKPLLGDKRKWLLLENTRGLGREPSFPVEFFFFLISVPISLYIYIYILKGGGELGWWTQLWVFKTLLWGPLSLVNCFGCSGGCKCPPRTLGKSAWDRNKGRGSRRPWTKGFLDKCGEPSGESTNRRQNYMSKRWHYTTR